MITDNIKNLKNYNLVPETVLNFLMNPPSDIGHYEIDDKNFANKLLLAKLVKMFSSKKITKIFFHRFR